MDSNIKITNNDGNMGNVTDEHRDTTSLIMVTPNSRNNLTVLKFHETRLNRIEDYISNSSLGELTHIISSMGERMEHLETQLNQFSSQLNKITALNQTSNGIEKNIIESGDSVNLTTTHESH